MGNVHSGVPRELVLWLSKTFGIDTFVETGTNRAETAIWASDNFEQVFTVEAYEPLHRKAVETFGHRKNIHFLKGDSRSYIHSITNSLTKPAIFWLDAHWCGEHTSGKSDECPIIGELRALNSSSIQHLVLIDDARLFLAPPPAPHEACHWPDIAVICQMLTANDSKRYVAVHDDVIIGVPDTARTQLVEFLRAEILQRGLSNVLLRKQAEKTMLQKIRSKIGLPSKNL